MCDIMQEIKPLKLRDIKAMAVCSGCKKFTNKYRRWNERKVPDVAITDYAECKKCGMRFEIYKGMCQPWKIIKKKRRSR